MNKIIRNLNLDQYNKKYRNLRKNLIKLNKKDVDNYDKVHINAKFEKNYLLKGRKWALIGDTYYQIPRPISFTWFRNLHAAVQVSTGVILAAGLSCSVALPIIFKPIPPYYTVNFDTDGGTPIKSIKVKGGDKIVKPTDPVKDFCKLDTWTKDGLTFDFNTPINSNITLKANYAVTATGGKVEGLNFGEKKKFNNMQELYDASSDFILKGLGGAGQMAVLDSEEKFRSIFNDIDDSENGILKANITLNLFSKDDDVLEIKNTDSRFYYSLGREDNYCGKDKDNGNIFLINKITFKSGSDKRIKLKLEGRPSASIDPLRTMDVDSRASNINTKYVFENIDFDNYDNDGTNQQYVIQAGNLGYDLTYNNCSFNQRFYCDGGNRKITFNNCKIYQDASKGTYNKNQYAFYAGNEKASLFKNDVYIFKGCEFDGYGRGIQLANTEVKDCVIENCTFKNIDPNRVNYANPAIQLSTGGSYTTFKINNNKFIDCKSNVFKFYIKQGEKVEINNNTIEKCGYVGWTKEAKNTYTMTSSGNTIKDTETNMCGTGDTTTSTNPDEIIYLN